MTRLMRLTPGRRAARERLGGSPGLWCRALRGRTRSPGLVRFGTTLDVFRAWRLVVPCTCRFRESFVYTNPPCPPVNCHNGSTLPSKDGRNLANRLPSSSLTNHPPTPLWSPTRLLLRLHFSFTFPLTARRHLFVSSPPPLPPPSISLSRTTATNPPLLLSIACLPIDLASTRPTSSQCSAPHRIHQPHPPSWPPPPSCPMCPSRPPSLSPPPPATSPSVSATRPSTWTTRLSRR